MTIIVFIDKVFILVSFYLTLSFHFANTVTLSYTFVSPLNWKTVKKLKYFQKMFVCLANAIVYEIAVLLTLLFTMYLTYRIRVVIILKQRFTVILEINLTSHLNLGLCLAPV